MADSLRGVAFEEHSEDIAEAQRTVVQRCHLGQHIGARLSLVHHGEGDGRGDELLACFNGQAENVGQGREGPGHVVRSDEQCDDGRRSAVPGVDNGYRFERPDDGFLVEGDLFNEIGDASVERRQLANKGAVGEVLPRKGVLAKELRHSDEDTFSGEHGALLWVEEQPEKGTSDNEHLRVGALCDDERDEQIDARRLPPQGQDHLIVRDEIEHLQPGVGHGHGLGAELLALGL